MYIIISAQCSMLYMLHYLPYNLTILATHVSWIIENSNITYFKTEIECAYSGTSRNMYIIYTEELSRCMYTGRVDFAARQSPYVLSYCTKSPMQCYKMIEQEKKRAYEERVREIEHGFFIPP